jgi:hypothetical protein
VWHTLLTRSKAGRALRCAPSLASQSCTSRPFCCPCSAHRVYALPAQHVARRARAMVGLGQHNPPSPTRRCRARYLKQTPSLPGHSSETMNASSMTVNMTKATLLPRLQLEAVNEYLSSRALPVSHRGRPLLPAHPLRVPNTAVTANTARVSLVSKPSTRKLLCGLLALSAVAWIACGLLTVLEHVQNWPIFNAWVGRILGA